MTGSLRLSALLLLLLSRWASADLEKGEDEFVRSWVIIEEQLVPPSRDELLATGGVGTVGTAAAGAAAGRRITPKSVFVAPSFNKCSDGYRPDSMGRCVKVVKLNPQAQWEFMLKQLNSMYGAGAGFPMPAAYRPLPTVPTTTTEPSVQKTDSPGPFQLNIPLGGIDLSSSSNQTMEMIDDDADAAPITTTPAMPSVNPDPGTVIATTTSKTSTKPSSIITTTTPAVDDDNAVDQTATTPTAATDIPVTTGRPSRPYRNRYQTSITDEEAATTTSAYETTTDTKTKYVDGSRTMAAEDSLKTTTGRLEVATGVQVGITETEEPVTETVATTSSTEAEDLEDVVTVLAVPALMMVPHSTLPPVGIPFTTVGSVRTQGPAVADTVTPEYYDDQPEELTAAPEPDCTVPNAHLYFTECAGYRQQQHEQYQQQQLLLQQHQQQQQFYQQQQQQQFYHQQLQQQQQQHHQQQQQHQHQQPHVATALVKRPVGAGSVGGSGVQVRFPEEDATGATSPPVAAVVDNVNLIRFPGPAPYRTTNKMYESSRHPTWWPTGWPEQQQQQKQQQQSDNVVQHQLQHHLPQQKQDVRLWEFGSRLPKTTTTAVPPQPAQWFHRFF